MKLILAKPLWLPVCWEHQRDVVAGETKEQHLLAHPVTPFSQE